MLTRAIARSLMAIIPEKLTVTIALNADSASPTSVTIYQAWLKPVDIRLQNYGGVSLQGNETLIMIPDLELNPAANGREPRARDTIVAEGITYRVQSSRIRTVDTVWECLARKEIV